MNYLAFQYIPYISLQTLDWCTSFNSFHMMKGLTSRLPKPLTKKKLRDPNPAYLLVEEYAHEDKFQNNIELNILTVIIY